MSGISCNTKVGNFQITKVFILDWFTSKVSFLVSPEVCYGIPHEQYIYITSRCCHLDKPVPVLAKQVIVSDYLAYDVTARPYVLDVKYEKAFESDVHERVQKAFRGAGILPPAVLHRSLPGP